jgi:hypothetical protein
MNYRTAIQMLLDMLGNNGLTFSEAKTRLHRAMNAQNPLAAPTVIREAIAGGHARLSPLGVLRATGLQVPVAQ